jgi:ClpP protease-like protein
VFDDADFTPNPDRAIWVEGQLNEALLERLRPEILELTVQNREPITVFINSRGGSPEVAEAILSLLRRKTQDDARASRIITVAAPKAKSAAANLLSAGDFAIAYPECTLLYHGARWPLSDLVAAGKCGPLFARTLPTFHELNAAALARNSVRRFLFIVSAERALFGQHRADQGDPTLTDLACFQAILRGKLSPAGQKVLELAIPICDSHNALLLQFQKRLRRGRAVNKAYLQKLMLHASIALEYERNKGNPAWDGGLSRISDHFYFLNAYFDFGTLCTWVAARAELQTADTDVEAAYFLQFRVFFLALCRALQEGENNITAVDAVWLGLIDTLGHGALALRASS